MRRQSEESGGAEALAGGHVAAALTVQTSSAAPEIVIEVCRCGCSGDVEHAAPVWPLATAWAFLTRPPDARVGDVIGHDDDLDDLGERELHELDGADDDDLDDDLDPAALPWWDARSERGRRRAVLPLVLLGELQAGVLLRALWEVVRTPGGPSA